MQTMMQMQAAPADSARAHCFHLASNDHHHHDNDSEKHITLWSLLMMLFGGYVYL